MQYIAIKEVEKDGKTVYCIPAISLKNKNQSVVQKIPHPMGTDILEFADMEQAQETIKRSGFACVMPDGKKVIQKSTSVKIQNSNNKNYDEIVYETIKSKIYSNNSNVVASAILAITEFPREETFEILIDKMGEDNDLIRKNSISGICRYGKILQDRIIKALESGNWVQRNSAVTCINNLTDQSDIEFEKFINPLVQVCQDQNPIVQSNALMTLAQVYNTFKSQKSH